MKLFFDTETTGLMDFKKPADHPDQPRIVSLAAITTEDDGKLIAEFNRLVRPDGWTMPEEVIAIHGITLEECTRDGIPILEVLDTFSSMIDNADQIIGYGVQFDLKMLRGEFRRAGMHDRYKVKPAFCVMNVVKPLCKMPPTMPMIVAAEAWGRKPGYKTPKLTEAVKILLDRELEGAHSAINDVRATVELYFKFCAAKEG